ncbi:hypothetical protein [Chryseobacterium vrystaatense]|uniref:NVEALA protein n=1 Tax=Chryseobacterium vrystaatense TaxID=307480 RepID=A0A1M5GJY0_9FLAO|nr:hypothetical protein [Chryseobacterium vrystaatense]SHG04044.1 hypothetical protein SAMN02787073_3384 [Chryseobacterium vrystaatense]
MKKFILLATFVVAGLVNVNAKSFGENKIDDSQKTQEQKIENTEKQDLHETNQQKGFNCVSYNLSCGWPGFTCGYSIGEILLAIWENDNNVCG